MNIAVMSPHVHGNGTTTVAALLASSLAIRNSKVCLTHVKSKSETLFPYYSISSTAQHTSPVQIVNLIKSGGMNSKSVPNYCRNVSDRFDIFSLEATEEDGVTEEDVADVVKYLSESAPYDYVIFDVDENSFDKPAVKSLLNHADCAIMVLTQKTVEMELFKGMQRLILAKLRKIPTIVVVNKFKDMLGTIKELASMLGVKNTRQWYTLHSNDNLLFCENHGSLKFLSEQMKERNGDVIDLEYDMQHIIQAVLQVKRDSRTASNVQREQSEIETKKPSKTAGSLGEEKREPKQPTTIDFSKGEPVGMRNRRITSETEVKAEDKSNPFGLDFTKGSDPFAYFIDEDDIPVYVGRFTDATAEGDDARYEQSVKQYITSLFYYVWAKEPEGERSIDKVQKLINLSMAFAGGKSQLDSLMDTLAEEDDEAPAVIYYSPYRAMAESVKIRIATSANVRISSFMAANAQNGG